MDTNIYSCGVIYRIKNTNRFLVGRVTGSLSRGKALWSIPKGINENDESYSCTAVRETEEETSIKLKEKDLIYIDKKLYKPETNKYLVIFEYQIISDEAVDIKDVKCTSTFYNEKLNRNLPELNKFMYIDINEAENYLNKRMYNIIKDLKIWN